MYMETLSNIKTKPRRKYGAHAGANSRKKKNTVGEVEAAVSFDSE